MQVTICYLTGRAEPCVKWALEAIKDQREKKDSIEFIVVDALGRSVGQLLDANIVEAVDRVSVVSPKANPWQGTHRVTLHDWWAKSQAANTALCLASHDYVAFLDDRSVPGDDWLKAVRRGAKERKSVLVGAYEKFETTYPQIDEEKSFKKVYSKKYKKTIEVDHRLKLNRKGKRNCGGAWLYGCTIALPLEWALAVNGFEEGMDSLGSEDVVFGLNLANAGYRIDFVPALFVALERSGSAYGPLYKRFGDGDGTHEKFRAAMERFGKTARTEFTPDIRAMRDQVRSGRPFPLPNPTIIDWYYGRKIRELETLQVRNPA